MKFFLAAAAALILALGVTFAPAAARDSYVIDDGHLLSPATISTINAKVADFNAITHKEVVVVTESIVKSVPKEAAEQLFAEQRINGVLIFIAKSPKTIGIITDTAAERFFPSGTVSAIRQAIAASFNSGDFNGGVNNGVDLVLSQYRSHLNAVRATSVGVPVPAVPAMVQPQTGGFNMSVIWWLIALAVIFFIVRGVFRAMAGPRMMPPGYGGPSGPMGGYPPGYGGGPGYGPGYGGGGYGGGGGFWSGMLGGLGGAFLGNELFGGNRTEIIEQNPGMTAGMSGGEYGGQNQGAGDASGFQSDPGQADMGNSSFGGWGGGDSGGGWGDTGGGGGGGGGDWGGGGGDGGGGGW